MEEKIMSEKIVNILFDSFSIKGEWDSELEEYYFPALELISKITDSNNAQEYWSILKNREITSKLQGNVEVVSLKDLFRIVQLIPSSKSNQIMMWLAEAGTDKIHRQVIQKQKSEKDYLKLEI